MAKQQLATLRQLAETFARTMERKDKIKTIPYAPEVNRIDPSKGNPAVNPTAEGNTNAPPRLALTSKRTAHIANASSRVHATLIPPNTPRREPTVIPLTTHRQQQSRIGGRGAIPLNNPPKRKFFSRLRRAEVTLPTSLMRRTTRSQVGTFFARKQIAP